MIDFACKQFQLDEIIKFGASVAWRFNKDSASRFDKVLIAGNRKGNTSFHNKGKYFIFCAKI